MTDQEPRFRKLLRELFEDLGADIVEERVINYVIRELHNGRNLVTVLQDPYVRNRLNEEKVNHVLENPQVIEVVEEELSKAFKTQDFTFRE